MITQIAFWYFVGAVAMASLLSAAVLWGNATGRIRLGEGDFTPLPGALTVAILAAVWPYTIYCIIREGLENWWS